MMKPSPKRCALPLKGRRCGPESEGHPGAARLPGPRRPPAAPRRRASPCCGWLASAADNEHQRLGMKMAKIETSTTGAGGARPRRVQRRHERQFGMWSSALVGPALLDSLRKLSPAAQMKNPVMFVVYAGSILTTILWIMALRGRARRASSWRSRCGSGSPCCSPTSPKPWPKAAASSRPPPARPAHHHSRAPAQGIQGRRRQPRHARRMARPGRQPALRAAPRRRGAGRGRRNHPRRWPGDRRRGVRRRKRHHRRIRARDPRIRRRLRPSPAARGCCRTGSSCASRPIPARASWTA